MISVMVLVISWSDIMISVGHGSLGGGHTDTHVSTHTHTHTCARTHTHTRHGTNFLFCIKDGSKSLPFWSIKLCTLSLLYHSGTKWPKWSKIWTYTE